MKIKNETLMDLIGKHGETLCSYFPKRDEYIADHRTIDDGLNRVNEAHMVKHIKTVDFMKVGYYFVVDSSTGEVLVLTSIGDQWGKLGFNDRISRIRRKATKQGKTIYDKHYMVDIVYVSPSKVKYLTDNQSMWNFMKGTKKTERNTILENARLIKKAYELKY